MANENTTSHVHFQIELTSSWKRVDIISQDQFVSQRDALEAARPRSSTEIDKVARTITEVPLVPHVSLSPNAEVFRPRSNTVPAEPLSRSLPATVPESPAQLRHRLQGSRTPKRKDVKVAPRFFPAFSKEKLNQVRAH